MSRICDTILLGMILVCTGGCLGQPVTGQIVVDPQHPAWFMYQGGGPFFMCGPGDPEGFLYRGTRNANGSRSGDQMTLIQKLSGTGANCIYLMAIRSHGGDGDATQNPYVDSDLTKGLDDDILNQWETWFTAMDNSGIVIFFFLYDDSASPFGNDLPAGGQLKPAEATFVDAMVSRFKHHRHLIWCVAEEYGEALTPAHAAKVAERIHQQDDRHHPVAIHQNSGTSFDFNGNPNFQQFAVQWNVSTAEELHAGALAARADVGGLVNINMSEFAGADTGATLRRKLWAIALGSAYAMVLDMDIASTPLADLQDCGRLVAFMQAARCNETVPHDELAREATDYVLADPGSVYIAYSDTGGRLAVLMTAGRYRVRWYDPASGNWTDQGVRAVSDGAQTFASPWDDGIEAAVYLERVLPPGPASDPVPPNGATSVGVQPVLSWTAGAESTSQAVYFGTVSPGSSQGSQEAASYTPGTLHPRTTYFWRIDEVNVFGTTIGPVWSFTTRLLPGDADDDGDVDQEDFGRFQQCLSPPGALPIEPQCAFANLNGDELVDQADLAAFVACFSGADVPADPGCH
ncbi:MAG: hypothetical protein HY718_13850 [Planctomycetes bacterium]|nr:hypothetical protein [Planctomycetota bacterium]